MERFSTNSKNRSTTVPIPRMVGSELLAGPVVPLELEVRHFWSKEVTYPAVLGLVLGLVTFSVRSDIFLPGNGRLKLSRLGNTKRSFTNFRTVDNKYLSTFGSHLRNREQKVTVLLIRDGSVPKVVGLFAYSKRNSELTVWHLCEGSRKSFL